MIRWSEPKEWAVLPWWFWVGWTTLSALIELAFGMPPWMTPLLAFVITWYTAMTVRLNYLEKGDAAHTWEPVALCVLFGPLGFLIQSLFWRRELGRRIRKALEASSASAS